MHKFILILIIISICFCSCDQIKTQDFYGDWIVNKATFKGDNITMATKTSRVFMLPVGFKNKFTVTFNPDSTVDLPGIYTEDIPCKWVMHNKNLIISFDTAGFKNSALSQLDSLRTQTMLNHDPNLKKTYAFKRDSILNVNSQKIMLYKNPIAIYSGVYSIEEIKDELILSSPTTKFELVNLEKAFNKQIDNMFK